MKTEAVVIEADGRATLREVDLPAMSATRVRVQTLVSGVSCGTEAVCASGQTNFIQRPYITGYQAVGAVVEVGSAVTGLNIGDLVVTTGGALWEMTHLFGGSHARQSIAEATALIPLSAQTPSLDTASYAVLAAVAAEGLAQADFTPGKLIGIFGLGMLGQLAGGLALIQGLRVIGINRSEWKCAAARKLGFDACCPPDVEAIRKAVQSLGGEGLNIAFDTTGSQEIFDLALQALGKKGELVLDGYYPKKFLVDFDLCHGGKNIRIHNPVGPGQQLAQTVKFIELNQLNVDSLISRRVKPGEVTEFYGDLLANHSRYLGAVIDWRG
jgi:2-desacetyl-2-hydroxyethyl bacteriochlorophyllide A dehydrogenase